MAINRLRYVNSVVPCPEHGTSIGKNIKVLQQFVFDEDMRKFYWVDVPTLDEDVTENLSQALPERFVSKTEYDTKQELIALLAPLVAIADAYDANDLDDEARKYYGLHDEQTNIRDPKDIDLYTGRGGGRLLTLDHCLKIREYLKG